MEPGRLSKVKYWLKDLRMEIVWSMFISMFITVSISTSISTYLYLCIPIPSPEELSTVSKNEGCNVAKAWRSSLVSAWGVGSIVFIFQLDR